MIKDRTLFVFLLIWVFSLILSTMSSNVFAGNTYKPFNGQFKYDEVRGIYSLNNNWEYLEKNVPFNKVRECKKLEWQNINLPHSWNAFDATDNTSGYRRDASWYRKDIFVPEFEDPKILKLYFEGINISGEIYVNGEKAGEHVGGYVGFTVDITPFIKKGVNNQILVCADNTIDRNIIPSHKSDFFIFGGITRDVWLQVLEPVHVEQLNIHTPKVSTKSAQTTVDVKLINANEKMKKVMIEAKVKDPKGKVVANKAVKKSLKKGASVIKIKLPTVKNPVLWSIDSPNLYKMEIAVKGSHLSDSVSEPFGYRWFEFEENGPFYLNGKRLLLRGTHRHEEHAGLGNAMPDSLHRKDMQMIKEMGANFVRLAHYPQDPEVYRACDELGLLVWDELPWCRGGMGGSEWQSNTKRLLKEMIIQNYNHPSIILWSVGNELYWLPDFPGGDNPDSLKMFVSELNDLAHQLDPDRSTTMRKYYDGADIVDVFSPSIWAGWYSGVYKTYEKALNASRKKYKRFFHAEYGGSSHVGRHTENPITGEGLVKEDEWSEQPNMINIKKVSSAGDWSENYIVDLFDWHLKVTEQLDWFTGNAQWAFKDFGTPLRPENAIPYMNQKGLVDREGKPKDAYYVFKSYWTTDPEFCYIESPTWVERAGKPDEKRQVCVFSNCDKVELVLNGVSHGKRERDINDFPACGFHWDLLFKEGENELLAIGYDKNDEVTRHQFKIIYTTTRHSRPAEIVLSYEQMSNGNYLVQARCVDKAGNTCLDFNERIYFDCSGSGSLKSDLGTPTGSTVIEFASGRAAVEYVPGSGEQTIIEARTQDFKGSYLIIDDRK